MFFPFAISKIKKKQNEQEANLKRQKKNTCYILPNINIK